MRRVCTRCKKIYPNGELNKCPTCKQYMNYESPNERNSLCGTLKVLGILGLVFGIIASLVSMFIIDFEIGIMIGIVLVGASLVSLLILVAISEIIRLLDLIAYNTGDKAILSYGQTNTPVNSTNIPTVSSNNTANNKPSSPVSSNSIQNTTTDLGLISLDEKK